MLQELLEKFKKLVESESERIRAGDYLNGNKAQAKAFETAKEIVGRFGEEGLEGISKLLNSRKPVVLARVALIMLACGYKEAKALAVFQKLADRPAGTYEDMESVEAELTIESYSRGEKVAETFNLEICKRFVEEKSIKSPARVKNTESRESKHQGLGKTKK